MRGLCEAAKKGSVCSDDLCRSNPDNTLCGFDKSEYHKITGDYEEYDPWYEEDNK